MTAVAFVYPIFLELAGRRCVVVGDGAVREGKVEGLLAGGATEVVVIATEPAARLDVLASLPEVVVRRRGWRPQDLDDVLVCVATAEHADERDSIAREARARRARQPDRRRGALRLIGARPRTPR